MSDEHTNVLSLAKDRMPPKVIAHKLGISQEKVYRALRRARREGESIPTFSTAKSDVSETPLKTPQISVPIRLHVLLVSEAERLGWTPSELAQNLLEKALLEGWSRHAR